MFFSFRSLIPAVRTRLRDIREAKLSVIVCLPAAYQALIQMETPGDPACSLSVQKEEDVTAVWPPGFLRTGRTPDLLGIQVLLQDPGEFDCCQTMARNSYKNCGHFTLSLYKKSSESVSADVTIVSGYDGINSFDLPKQKISSLVRLNTRKCTGNIAIHFCKYNNSIRREHNLFEKNLNCAVQHPNHRFRDPPPLWTSNNSIRAGNKPCNSWTLYLKYRPLTEGLHPTSFLVKATYSDYTIIASVSVIPQNWWVEMILFTTGNKLKACSVCKQNSTFWTIITKSACALVRFSFVRI